MKKVLVIIVFTILGLSNLLHAQDYRYEIGAGLGISGYLGDVNKSNLLKHPGFAGGALFRYIIDYRWALKANLYTAGLSGNSADYDDVLPEGVTYKFNSQVYDLGAMMEFNFFNFGLGYNYKHLKRLSPYLALGIGTTLSSCNGTTAFAINIPMGVGVKFKLKERLNLGFDFTIRKVFGDKVDGFNAGDLTHINSSFLKNTDWYSTMMFTITYEFSKRCVKCHYVD